MHPAIPGFENANITFKLGKGYSKLTGEIGYNDTAPPEPPSATFTIYGDGKQLWSRVIFDRNRPEPFDISTAGIDLLTIEVAAIHGAGAHTVWIEPVLTK